MNDSQDTAGSGFGMVFNRQAGWGSRKSIPPGCPAWANRAQVDD